MFKLTGCLVTFLFILFFLNNKAYCQQQDVDFHLTAHLLTGKKILKVKCDFYDPYVWVLAQNNEVYRVNTQTLGVDDYTAKFAAYNNLQFVDIVGHSQDTVFIATNSTNLIIYNKGNISSIGQSQGITDVINSIGITNRTSVLPSGTLIIATQTGMGEYDIKTGKLTYSRSNELITNKVFAATYRRLLYTDPYRNDPPGPIPVVFSTLFDSYAYDIRQTTESGQNLNTAFYTLADLTQSVYDGCFFWGAKNGMFEESLNFQGEQPSGYAHFFNNIKINKITDIFGLTSLGNPFSGQGLIKETLLIGSDDGFYFTSSLFGNYTDASLHKFTIFHYDALANTPINDICVNATSASAMDLQTNCENGVWLAANDGLYYLNPDYGKYLDHKEQFNVIRFNLPNADTISHVQICSGSNVSINLSPSSVNNNSIQWVKDGKDIVGETSPTLSVKDSGEFSAILYTPCENVHVETNHLKVSVVPGPVFTLNYPDKIQYCDSSSTTLKLDYNPSYQYRWYQNDVLNGNTTASCTVTQSGKYKVEVSLCTNSWVPSKEIEVDLINLPQPSITSNKNIYCQSDTALLSANTLVDTSYTINWYKDGVLLSNDKNLPVIKAAIAGNYSAAILSNITSCSKSSAGFQLGFTPAPTFTFNYADVITYCAGSSQILEVQGDPSYQYRWYKDGVLNGMTTTSITITQTGKYKVEVSACPDSWISSKEVQANFLQLSLPVITPDKLVYCIGDQATLNLNIPADPSYTITWLKDGNVIDAYQGLTSIITNLPGIYAVNIISNTIGNCSQSALPVQIIFNPPPTVSIQEIINTTLCDGQDVSLKANYSNGTVKWSTGESTDGIDVNTSGNYTATITSVAGCVADTSINLHFFPRPVLSLRDTAMCEFTKQTVTLTAPAGYNQYVWNGRQSGNTFTVNYPQNITLVVTDKNGCQASQQIVVSSTCPDILMANAFTPNGDGINDTWTISGLDNDKSAMIQVFNRYGAVVYKSKGYANPWDGRYNGGKLPAGVYYYIINAKNGKQTLSGSVTIIY
jgi:gliding motility-associated-like protein